jgi:hypothetical protein
LGKLIIHDQVFKKLTKQPKACSFSREKVSKKIQKKANQKKRSCSNEFAETHNYSQLKIKPK